MHSITLSTAERTELAIGANSKALLAFGKALPSGSRNADNQAMLSTAEALKRKLAAVLAGGLSQAAIAKTCGVSKQAVQGWKNTGRIDKKHLPALAVVSGRPLEWWLDYSQDAIPAEAIQLETYAHTAQDTTGVHKVKRWPFSSIEPEEYALLSRDQHKLVEGFVRGLLAEAKRDKSKTTPRAA